ncbi:MAG TPA: pyridoxamine 5'-phosphate oxidase family protein [Blastocatellia bacterium]|nr:pyridoxamine 5'-phosphate oxidase family protein [Blastocatellia bacterium]
MGKRILEITPELQNFIEEQSVFFVASAPLSANGHVNISPKGLDTFRVIGPRQVAYLDLTGSGNETAAHVMENERLTIMFCAFFGRPQIVRLYCRARVVVRGGQEWSSLIERFPSHPGQRQVIVGDVEFVQTSCGYAVPEMKFVSPRETLTRWADAKGDEGLVEYRRMHNRMSIDALEAPVTDASE